MARRRNELYEKQQKTLLADVHLTIYNNRTMNITSTVNIDQTIPISKARANLPSLVDRLADENYFVLVKKYKPKAALVDLTFLEKLLSIYQTWQRKNDFASLEEIRNSIPQYSESETKKDVSHALNQIRKKAKSSS